MNTLGYLAIGAALAVALVLVVAVVVAGGAAERLDKERDK